MFELHPALERDSVLVGYFTLCQLRLMNDSQFPWFVLVPQRNNVTEIYQLAEEDRQQLMAESCLLAETIHDAFAPDKLNVAAIGNKVTQLHIHHVARFAEDSCWPEPIWGKKVPVIYEESELAGILQKIRSLLSDDLKFPSEDSDLYY